MKLSQQDKNFIAELTKVIDRKNVMVDELRTLAWGTDASFYRITPRFVVHPKNEEEVAHILRTASRFSLHCTFRAAGTSLSGQALSSEVLIVTGKNWEKYVLAADKKSICLQPGMVGGRVNEILKPFGRVFPPDPASIGSAMVGGIIANNASGMNCGVHANSDRMLLSVKMILADGTVLDTADEQSKALFRKTHANLLARLEALRDRIRNHPTLADRIRKKYSIKNVTGLNLRPLVAYDDPFDIMAHSLVGSEGTLAFLSEIRIKTLKDYPFKASAMIYFYSMKESCEAVVALKNLLASEEHLEWSAERLAVKSAEMLDYRSLAAVNDPVFLAYKTDVDNGNIQGVKPGNYHGLTAILTETKAITSEQLDQQIAQIKACLQPFSLYRPAEFTTDPKIYGKYWAIRAGIFPSVGGSRPIGTSCLIEDVAFPINDLPEATVKLQKLIAEHGYQDACIYGHAFEGNYHFILNQFFNSEKEVKRYRDMMKDVAKLVVEDYDGSLKAEHGTGRNMAPFVLYEWGEEAFSAMQELKKIFDPEGLLNPGTIFNNDPECFIKNLKPLPLIQLNKETPQDASSPTAQNMRKGVEEANKCIECGFCEVNCLSCGLTLSSRQRIAVQREISKLRESDEHPERLLALEKQYRYFGNQTCAGDGLCATSCPMGINVGELTHWMRQQQMPYGSVGYNVGSFAARHFKGVKQSLKGILYVADTAHNVLGTSTMTTLSRQLHKLGAPLWTSAMPKARKQSSLPDDADYDKKVVYFPSCINQTMGLKKDAPVRHSLVEEMVSLCHKAGYGVIFPEGMDKLCCGTIWESKGMPDIADRKVEELEKALLLASDQGRYPILCDQSPCLHRMRKCITQLRLYEPVEFIMTFLKQELDFHPIDRHIAVHVTCSTREMGLTSQMIELARLCSNNVCLPEGVGCCGFAGDKGWTHPELNAWALRKLRRSIEDHSVEIGYSNSRTCEVGLQTNGRIPYVSIVYLVNEVTTPKNSV